MINSEDCKLVTINGVETEYLIYRDGTVLKINGEKLNINDNGAGYKIYGIYHKGKTRIQYIHRLVAQAFLPNPDNLPQVNHIDCDKCNNHVDNLEWVSASKNILHAHSEGRMVKRTSNGQINVLDESQVKDLYLSVKRGMGISEKARQIGIPRTTASSIMNKRSRSDITDMLDKGAIWNVKNGINLETQGY